MISIPDESEYTIFVYQQAHIENSVDAAGVDDRKYEDSEDSENFSDGINYSVFPNNKRCGFMVCAFDPVH